MTTSGKMQFKPVSYDVHEIAPDAPEGEWVASIPRGQIKIQPTKEDKYPMLIIPLRLDKYSGENEGEQYEKALGTVLSLMIVFFGNEKAKAARMGKLRLRQLCEAADVDLDAVPTEIRSEEDFAELVTSLEGKKFTVWTKHNVRKDTQETVVDVVLQKPGGLSLTPRNRDEDEGDDNHGHDGPAEVDSTEDEPRKVKKSKRS